MISISLMEGRKEFKEYREIRGCKDIGKEVYFYDFSKNEFYIKGILKGFDCNCYEIETKEGLKIYQIGYIKEEGVLK
jgi:hypothetical protein